VSKTQLVRQNEFAKHVNAQAYVLPSSSTVKPGEFTK